jgi:hypothetical protein
MALLSSVIVIRRVNDWNSLFKHIFNTGGYQKSAFRVRTEVVVGSFYTQLAAPGSVALGTCFTASHWLSSALSLTSPGTVWFADLQGEARAKFKKFARADWTQFLRCRATELQPGGMMIVSTLGSIPDSNEINGIRSSASSTWPPRW